MRPQPASRGFLIGKNLYHCRVAAVSGVPVKRQTTDKSPGYCSPDATKVVIPAYYLLGPWLASNYIPLTSVFLIFMGAEVNMHILFTFIAGSFLQGPKSATST